MQFAGALVEFLALFGAGIIMARLLGPKEFGIFAMVVSLTAPLLAMFYRRACTRVEDERTGVLVSPGATNALAQTLGC